ncbi:MAG TPA: CBS domain-containing protein [Candidatus Acidoferrales bacterium]|nr:CBS domain-containing protein [Candidatus Acidoferrales bacterium]
MTKRVHCVRPLDSIQHARELMESSRVNQLPVVIGDHLVGIVTDRDLRDAYPSVFAAARNGHHTANDDPQKITVETIMTPHIISIGPKDTMIEAARRMRQERIGALPVLDGQKLVGIVARSDVLDVFVAMQLGDSFVSDHGTRRTAADADHLIL